MAHNLDAQRMFYLNHRLMKLIDANNVINEIAQQLDDDALLTAASYLISQVVDELGFDSDHHKMMIDEALKGNNE